MKEENTYRHNLLVIDDEVEITKSLFRQFRKKYNVFVANNAEDAMPILEKEDIQVVLSDQRMPGMTGITFFSSIKDKYPQYKDMDDLELAKKIIAKYPQYKNSVNLDSVKKKENSKGTSVVESTDSSSPDSSTPMKP